MAGQAGVLGEDWGKTGAQNERMREEEDKEEEEEKD